MNQELGPRVAAGETNEAEKERTEFAHGLQTTIAACGHDGEVIDVLTEQLLEQSRTDLEQALMHDVGVFTLTEAQYYQNLLRGLHSPAPAELQSKEVVSATEVELDKAVYEAIGRALEAVTEEEIALVSQLSSVAELDAQLRHPVRSKFRDIVDPLVESARTLIYQSSLRTDLERRAAFPHIWLVLDKLDRMLRAVGHIEQGVIHHTRTLYRDLPTRSRPLD